MNEPLMFPASPDAMYAALVRLDDAEIRLHANGGLCSALWLMRDKELRQRMASEVLRLRDAIRIHRDQRGDDRCFQDDATLYAVLPEGDTRPMRDAAVTIENCERYIACRQQGREYVSPQRRIEELEADVARLRDAFRLFVSQAASVLQDNTDEAITEALKAIEEAKGVVER